MIDALVNEFDVEMIIHGGAIGADSIADDYATSNGIQTRVFKPDWDLLGKRAGFVRNSEMVEYCDKGVAFWDGVSRGTKDSIDKLKKMDKLLDVVRF